MGVCISVKYLELFNSVLDGHKIYIKKNDFSLFKARKLIFFSD